jgi:CheY-like chemotaxis protein
LLLLEDDRVEQFTLEQQLSRLGYDVVCADDAERARGWPPSWIVVPTGEPAHEGRSRQAGADRVLRKPATGDEMSRALEAGEVAVRATRPTAAD